MCCKNKKAIILCWLVMLIGCNRLLSQWNPDYSIGTSTGKYVFNYQTKPDPLVEIISPVSTAIALNYQWESSSSAAFTSYSIVGNASGYSFLNPLSQTTYFRRKTTDASNLNNFIYSNIIEIDVASVNWENINYIREHDVLTTGVTNWQAVDQLPIGQKLQATTYLDGLGRLVEKVSRETATPSTGTLWGDAVQFSQYDNKGREPKQYLPYTIQYSTTIGTESGKYKSAPLADQPQYYTSVYNETAPYANISFDNSPLNRISKVNAPGTSWKNSNGEQATYDLNTAADHVQIWSIGYNIGDAPVDMGEYAANTLYKTVHYDEDSDQTVEYRNKAGQLILTKQQISDAPSANHGGWICTYNIYDDFGLLRYVLQPNAVNYLVNNGWSFADANGQQVLNELCFRYEYDEKGRCILKKAPGATPLRMIYDGRDRVVFMQDGNQAVKSQAEWTVNFYDDLDRVTMTALYRTNETVAQLQADINNSVSVTTVTTTTAGDAINDLVVDTRNASVSNYTARSSIIFTSDDGGSFSSVANDNFTAQINPNASAPAATAIIAVYNNPISSVNLNNPAVTTILKYEFYDDYSYTRAKAFDNSFNNTTAYSNSDPNVIPIAKTKRTLSLSTGSMVRVLGTNTFLTTTEYYDEKGHLIQTTEDNIKKGQDVTTFQYHFDGRLLSTHEKHSTAYSGYNSFSILTKNVFDKIGRISSIQKQYGSNAFKTIAAYDYDDMGRLKVKHLDPGYTGSGKTELESLAYSYNIHNQITGINKDYALKNTGYDKWGNFFGLYLGYDNRDNFFTNAQLDGHVTGVLWNTQGDDAQRKYDFSYDNAGRLINAAYIERQTKTGTWDKSKMDFSITGTNGSITYDLNGNLTNMLQKGVMPGLSAPVDIDKLIYTYTNTAYTYTNKLFKVKDNTAQTVTNGLSGDFKNGTNGSTDDYVYDNNGNLITDNNKAASSITYNFLDKPELITITGKGTIKIVYDAEGNKLQKIFTPQGGGQAVTTTYINEFVYKGDAVQYINFEEGRIRIISPVSKGTTYNGVTTDALIVDGNMTLPNSKEGVYDYFIRDYQENVRMILTEEVHTGYNTCTMETARKTQEDAIFQGAGNEVENARTTKPAGWNSNASTSVSKLGTTTGTPQVGPNVLLKVMAGDVINATSDYYYQTPVTNTSGITTLTQNIVTSIISAITGGTAATAPVKQGSAGISTALQPGINAPFLAVTQPDQTAASTTPKAYLTVLFLDERFNYVGTTETTPYVRVSQSGDNASPLVLANLRAPKNGYAYVYLSNESAEPVYFDNFKIGLNHGRIIEEDHYYAFGLKIAAISSQKISDPNEGNIDNKNLYNDKELFDDADLDWYDYGFRNYDAQIARFTQLDPLTWDYPDLTNYQYASNDPIANIDIDGLEGFNAAFTGIENAANQLPDVVVHGVINHTSWLTKATNFLEKSSTKLISASKEILEDAGAFTLGGINAFTSDHLGGAGLVDAEKSGLTDSKGLAFQIGQKVGHAGALFAGISELALEGTGEGLSLGIATVPVAAAIPFSLSAVGHGAYHLVSGKIVYSTGVKNGETNATKDGKDAHAYDNYSPGSNYKTRRTDTNIDGSYPDAVDYENKVVRELKPNNDRKIREGINQAKKYLQRLQEKYDGKWKFAVDTYDKNPDGTFTYHYGQIQTL